MQTIQYFDGFGRPTQTVQRGATQSGTDLVSLIEYDGFGRESKNWLPIPVSGNTGAYVNTFTNDAPVVYSDSRPYSENLYEASPANRVLGQYGPGISWYSNGKKTVVDRQTNGTSEVIKFDYGSSYYRRNGYYAANTLYKTITKDEDGKTFTEYKDKLGQVILQRKGTNVDTYFIYDDFGRVVYVLPPNVLDQSYGFNK